MKKRILFVAPNLRISNGITSFIMGNYYFLLENKYEIDFLLTWKIDSPNNKIVEDHGSKIFVFPHPENKYSRSNGHYIRELLAKNNYDIIHCNETGMYAYWVTKEADKEKVPHIVYHAHNPKGTGSIKARLRAELFDRLCFRHTTDYISCTDHAGKSVFGNKKFYIVKNGVDFSKYRFDLNARKQFRKDLGIENSVVVGTVCRQAEQKNPYFIVDVIKELVKYDERFLLLWVGTGPLRAKIEDYAEQSGVAKKIYFLGDRMDTNKVYSAMDCFLLPSKYEGLGIVYLEAQASGLHCFASDAVPKETNLTGNISYYSLSDSPENWAKKMIDRIQLINIERDSAFNLVMKSDMELANANNMLIKAYQQIEG